jgi:hypothetical protein
MSLSMSAFPIERFFRLSESGTRCSKAGLFVGPVAMLERSNQRNGKAAWSPRPLDELERDLQALYGLPIDASAKRGGLATVAKGLTSGDLALAQVAAVLLRFPDPPLVKGGSRSPSQELALVLRESGLVKWYWNPAEHPRTGEPPNPGWFAPKDADDELSPAGWPESVTDDELKPRLVNDVEPAQDDKPKPIRPIGPWRIGVAAIRAIARATGTAAIATGKWLLSEIEKSVEDEIAGLERIEVMEELEAQRLERDIEEAKAFLDPPKTQEELQTPPTENVLRYDLHHDVNQNPTNLAKLSFRPFRKFGRDRIDAPSNLFWVPRLKHQQITRYYNGTDPYDPMRRPRRVVISEKDFDTQYKIGLDIMRRFGVLK